MYNAKERNIRNTIYDTDDYDKKYRAEDVAFKEQSVKFDSEEFVKLIDKFYTTKNGYDTDPSLDQLATVNKRKNFNLPTSDIDAILNKCRKIDDCLYNLSVDDCNLIFIVMQDLQITVPEYVLEKLYSPKLKRISNKRYCIITNEKHISKDYLNNFLSSILKVRAMENYCAVAIYLDNFNTCYQCGMNRTVQVVKAEKGNWGLDFNRITGPEAIWKNKAGMRESWRENFEWLIQRITNR